MRRLSAFAALCALALTACGGGESGLGSAAAGGERWRAIERTLPSAADPASPKPSVEGPEVEPCEDRVEMVEIADVVEARRLRRPTLWVTRRYMSAKAALCWQVDASTSRRRVISAVTPSMQARLPRPHT